jgi:hypothetical protein
VAAIGWGFMDFVGKVELSEWVGSVGDDVLVDEGGFLGCYGFFVLG